MTARLLATLAMCISTSGCFLILPGGGGGTGGGSGGGGGGLSGNVTISWTFAGRNCSQAGVSTVAIVIDGETLANNGVYGCLTDNYPGIQLNNFRAGTYAYRIDGRGYASETLYTRSGTFTVNGDISLTLDLLPVNTGGNTYAYLTWTFPANSASSNPDCTQAGIASVLVSIDGAAETSISCASGWNTSPGVQTPLVAAGTHTIDLTAVNSSGYAYYAKRSTLLTQVGNPTAQSYALDWAVGGAAVAWTLVDGSLAKSCSQAGVTSVSVNFQDTTTNALLYGTNGDPQACGTGAVKYDFLIPGHYRIIVQGYGAASSLFSSNYAGGPEVTITAGVFVPLNQAQNVVMYRM